ncbi:MBL fold metallo-hydrolase [Flexithrix dorotheae]|uniref:MBL fold metallo-hydrolase n=1 Tax=Flexithrix dorotheae TaxID=70993 RepID=UPI00037A4F74|nr:MBL fold metallo-hydrolase [Flexithrix dorotheae]
MKIEQIYTGCLAQGAYYIESKGEAAVIDPLREVDGYLKKAERNNAKIKYIFETHFHADFVSGHVTLAEKTEAPIVYGPNANPDFEAIIATDNQEFKLGDVTIRVLHTPGHTMESTTFLLLDEEGKEHAIFSGDTLFLGDVGRPDLAQKAADMTQEELAGILFESLRNKIMTLPDETIVYPGHGAGSACGKNMSKETVGTIGEQKRTNYALRADMSKEEFIKEVTTGLLPPPAYFPLNVMLNKQGYEAIDKVLEKGQIAMSPEAFEAAANETGAVVLDVRHQSEFAKGHIPNSIFIGIDGGFAPWVGALIQDVKQPILLVAAEERLEEVMIRLARVGFDNVIGYLEGGFASWEKSGKETDSVELISAEELANLSKKEKLNIYDVRKESEFLSEHILDAENTPLDFLNDYLATFKKDGKNYVHCAGGYRSMIANSILKARGIHNVVDVAGGFGAIKRTDIPKSNYVCPSTL